jgi:UDP-N-acetylglucosamine 2-epimerase (non-hydrolysing)
VSERLMLVLGIRPDVIRASLLIPRLKEALGNDLVFIWSGQHYSNNLKDIFFSQLSVPLPDIELHPDTRTETSLIGSLISDIGQLLTREQPSACCFLGDTNTVLGSIACASFNVPIIHIEGCMRSYDWRMPEEKFRTVIDHLSDVIYAYLPTYRDQGLAEGLDARQIVVTGNPIVDVLEYYFLSGKLRLSADMQRSLLQSLSIPDGERPFVLMTCHRRENVEDPASLRRIMKLVEACDYTVVFPASYRTQRSLAEFSIVFPSNLVLTDPIGYVEFLELLDGCTYALTDSGTVVEEAAVLGVPSVQMRLSTERPEVYEWGASIKFNPTVDYSLSELHRVHEEAEALVSQQWTHQFGDGKASQRIADDILKRLKNPSTLRGHKPEGSTKPFSRNWQ